MLRSKTIVCVYMVVGLSFAASTQAEIIVIGNVRSATTAPTVDNTYGGASGTLEFALNLGGVDLTRDGIPYTGVIRSGSQTATFYTSESISVTGTTDSGSTWASLNFGGDPLFNTIEYPTGSRGFYIDITGLTPTRDYQVQYLFGDPRTAYPYTGTVTLTDSLSNTATTAMRFGTSDSHYELMTATVSGSTSLRLTVPPAPLISGIVLHSVPEPGTALLMIVGMGGLFCCRWRQRK